MKILTKEELYKSNQKKIKALKMLTPIVFWGALALSVLFLVLALRNSIGNLNEIFDLLDSKKYNDIEIEQHYFELIEKYGAWGIGSATSFQLVFINVKAAVASGFAIFCFIMFVLFFVGAFLVGKWLLPLFTEKTIQENQDMCNLEILKAADKGRI